MDLCIKWIASADHWFLLRDAKIFYQPCFISEVCSDTLGGFSHFVPTINNDLGEQTVQIFGRSLWACSILVQISRLSIQIIFGTQLYACILLRLEFSRKNCHKVSIIQSVLALLIIFTSRAYNPTYLVNHSIFVVITELLMGKSVGLTFVIYMIIIMRGAIRVTSLYLRYTEQRNEDTAHCYVSVMSYVTSISERHFLLLVHTLVLRNIYHFITS